jgi:hypothetical protein
MRDLLVLSVFKKLEVFAAQLTHELTPFIGHDDIDLDQLNLQPDGWLTFLFGRLRR